MRAPTVGSGNSEPLIPEILTCSAFAGKTSSKFMNFRAVQHRLDEPRQSIPQHGCLPAEPVSVSPGEVIVMGEWGKVAACCRRSCRKRRACSSLRSRSAWISAWRPSSMSCGVT